jgi:catalase
MNRKLLVLILSAAAVTTSTATLAAEIYKYVDEDGNVEYMDRPSGDPGGERMDVTYARTDNASVSAQVEQRREYMDTLEEARDERASRRESEAQARAEVEERAAKCQEHRARLDSYLQSRRLYRQNEAGEREYLDEAQVLEARRRVEEQIQEYCS